ncbi:cytochrome P450 [Xylariaceae sp. FL1651]|nr:cytochrome P450 [Xylariaceae sp. FL1651]
MAFSSVFEAISELTFGAKALLFIGLHVIAILCITLWKRLQRTVDLDLPVVGDANASDFREAMEEGARKYPNSPYVLPASTGRLVILPPTLIDELRLLPESTLSSKEHHYRHFLGRWTSMGTPAPELHSALTIDLQRNVQKVMEAARGEVDYAFNQNIPPCDDWTSVPVFPALLHISALLIERTWVGLPLSRQDNWIKATTSYMTDVAKAAAAIKAWPNAVRTFIAPLLKDVMSLKSNRGDVIRMIKPLIQDQFRQRDAEKHDLPAGGELFTWIFQRYKGNVSAERIARDELMATFSSLYTVTATFTQALFDLAARPEYLQPLRDEIDMVLVDDPDLTQKTSLLKLKKMDSFIKESQRMNPLGLTTMMRVVMDPKGLKLSSGDVIPFGETVAGPNHAVNFSSTIYSNPAEFDGFRYSKLREIPGNETKHQFISTSTESINFGHGIGACPGRFFASTEIKIMLVYLLSHFDVKLAEGSQRPQNVYTGTVCLPDMQAPILFKKRV